MCVYMYRYLSFTNSSQKLLTLLRFKNVVTNEGKLWFEIFDLLSLNHNDLQTVQSTMQR